ncbi:TPA: hypothetical protein QCI16_003527 [Enterobacter ludwigii]|nr:hypothetical protein [Enterobacter ludwigii]HDR2599337.1 hypothetical protein [Enterobacter ludwigii]
MTNVSVVEKISELMQQIEVNSPRVAALHYCLSEAARHIAELEQKLAESQREFRAADATIENLQMQVEKLAAEAQGFKRFFLFAINAAFDGCDITGDQIQEVAKEIGLVRVETYSAEKHAEMSGDPSVMEEGDDFYIMNKTPATEAFLAEVRASAVDEACLKISNAIVNCYQDEQIGLDEAATICGDFASEIRKGVQS